MRSVRRRIAVISTFFLTIAAVVPAYAADSYPPLGEAAVGTAQPVVSGYRVQSIRDWSPDSDPFAQQLRATIPLQKRIPANAHTQVKPMLDGKSEIMLMQGDYGNSFFGSTPYNNTFSDHTFNFWQYADYWSPWHGAASHGVPQSIYDPASSNWQDRGFEFGILSIPTPEYTNAAHRNGVKSIAVIYFDPYFRPGLTFGEMFDKDPKSHGYVIAQKLVEMAKYYGFDGYFLNQEERGTDPSEFKDFMAFLTRQGLYTQWYDTNSQFNADKAQWLRDPKHGRIHNSVFVNYGNDGKAMNAWATANGFDPYREVFAGVEANQTGFSGTGGVDKGFISQANHSPLTSIALFTPSDYYQRGLDDQIEQITGRKDKDLPFMQQDSYQWMISERERMYFSGPKQDVTSTGAENLVTREDVGITKTGWIGVADFVPARSVISGKNFYSVFNTGKGMRTYQNGRISSEQKFSNMGAQSILPSWQWWITSNDKPTLKADFDYGKELRTDVWGKTIQAPFVPIGGYDGGSSLVLYGAASQPQTIRLFKTDLSLDLNSKAAVVWKNTQAYANVQLAVVFADAPTEVVTFPLGDSSRNWQESVVELGKYSGQKVVTLGIQVENAAQDKQSTQVNIGKLAISDGLPAPKAPRGLRVDEYYADGQMNISWEAASFDSVDSYVVEAVDQDGAVRELGRGYGRSRYVKNVGTKDDFVLQVRAIGKDGQSSAPAKVLVKQSMLPQNLTIDTALDEQGNFVQAKNAGAVSVSWDPVSNVRGYEIRLKTLYVDSANPYHGEAKVRVDASQTDVTIPAPLEGERFLICVKPLGIESGSVKESCQRGRYHDSYAAPMLINDIKLLSERNFHLQNPTSTDWQKITSHGDETWVATRGKNNNSRWGNNDENGRLTVDRSVVNSISYTLTDYAGNVSQPVELVPTGQGLKIVDQAAPEVWGTPWNAQVVLPGREIVPIQITTRDNIGTVKVSVTVEDPQHVGRLSMPVPKLSTHCAQRAARKTLVFDEKTGTIFGTPNWKGVRNVVVTATDESGNSKKMSIQITGSRRADFWSAMQCNLH
ncbi:endo-beta-N-acetylglucosaminidase D [Arcanobacterium pluranimalium]|uniref:endo-beta-N-acetylglucosaminidase n=1 Tax=Arcanobacterium pluranimalium TaxID=108028 RepID=UPI00195C1EF6|nr:putative Ig domain-containing protein [Arcanobacterium pluranimalium]MBM7824320.1 endo-beta-N-acetylglucosaminidase D [Arcanobacterium pluranimalium]